MSDNHDLNRNVDVLFSSPHGKLNRNFNIFAQICSLRVESHSPVDCLRFQSAVKTGKLDNISSFPFWPVE